MTAAFDDLLEAPQQQDFLLALRRLETAFRDRPRVGDSATRREEYVKLGQNPAHAFPASTIDASRREDGGNISLYVRFLGLTGPHGPLPLAFTHEAHQYLLDGDDALARFLDLFNNRFLQLFFRAWADARPIAQHDRPSDDRFKAYVGGPIGLGSDVAQDLGAVPDLAKLGFAGLTAPTTKSASRLRAFIAGLFGVLVEVEEFAGLRLMLEPEERSYLGRTNARLGEDAILGSGIYSVQDKIRLHIHIATLEHYVRFLPDGDLAPRLADAVHFYVGFAPEYDVELSLPAKEAAPMRLGQSGKLGWTSWLAPDWTTREERRSDAHFDLARRFVA